MAAAILLSLLLGGQTLAATWSAPRAVAASDGDLIVGSADLAALNGSTTVAVYERYNGQETRSLFIRRSIDSGATWQAPMLLTDHGVSPRIAGQGLKVAIVWLWDGRVQFARSADGGRTFGAAVALSSATARASDPSVAMGANGLLVAAWSDASGVRARVSADHGMSFRPARTIANARGGTYARAAAGNGVAYVFYLRDWETLFVRRSFDVGRSWTSPARIMKSGIFEVAAHGDQAIIVSESWDWWNVSAARTPDRGARWRITSNILTDDWQGYYPLVSLDAHGVARVVFEPCSNEWDICSPWGAVFYLESDNGSAWTSPKPVHPAQPERSNTARAIAVGRRVMVLYSSSSDDGSQRLLLVSRSR